MAGRATCESCVRGYHVYKSIWTAEIGETLVTKPEFGNSHDPYALAVVDNNNIIVGHLPRNIAALCHLFLHGNETIIVQITGKRRFSADLPQGGLELPCSLIFDGETKDILKVKKLLCAAPTLPVEVSDKQDKNKALSEKLFVATSPWSVTGKPSKKQAKVDLTLCDETEDANDKSNSSVWLKFDGIYLLDSDKQVVANKEKLHINFAQRLLHNQFPSFQGFGHTLVQKKRPVALIQCGLQIIHDRNDHWIVASNIGCGDNIIQVYDSVYRSVSPETREVIINLFRNSADISIEIVDIAKQKGATVCGLYAIAIATNLLDTLFPRAADGEPPLSLLPKQKNDSFSINN